MPPIEHGLTARQKRATNVAVRLYADERDTPMSYSETASDAGDGIANKLDSDRLTGESAASMDTIYQIIEKKRMEKKQEYDAVDVQFTATQQKYDEVRHTLEELAESRKKIEVANRNHYVKVMFKKPKQTHAKEDDTETDAGSEDDEYEGESEDSEDEQTRRRRRRQRKLLDTVEDPQTASDGEEQEDDEVLINMFSVHQSIKAHKTQSEELRIRYDQLEPLRRRLSNKVQILDQIMSFVKTFDDHIVPQWNEFCESETRQIGFWTPIRKEYHRSYLASRKHLWSLIDSYVNEVFSHIRMKVCSMLQQLNDEHVKQLREMREYFEENSNLIAKSNSMIREYHQDISEDMKDVSNELRKFMNQLREVVIHKEKQSAKEYVTILKQMVQMFWVSLSDMSTRLYNSKEIRAYLARLDKCCCEEHRTGIAHPLNEHQSKLPCIVLKGTTLDKAFYQMNCSAKGSQAGVRPSVIKQRVAAANQWSRLNHAFDQVEEFAAKTSVAAEPNVYIKHQKPRTLV
jgi:hypothetical protein